jgi:hypothetical protein
MTTVAAVHTGVFMVDLIKNLCAEILPDDVKVISIVDDGIIAEAVKAGGVTPAITKRLISYYHAGVDAGADIVFNTCSSVGEVADLGAKQLKVPLFKIDVPMATQAVEMANTVCVLATLPTTLGPTVRLVKSRSVELGKPVGVLEGLAEGAFDKFLAGDTTGHDQMILDTAMALADKADVFVLAQASMSRMEATLAEKTGKPVLASPRLGVLGLKEAIEKLS